jgi:outer membrane murein-binding lipoprotein Lpp
MKTHSFYLLAGAVGLLAVAAPISGQNAAVRPAAKPEASPQVLALIDQLSEQNKELTANQAKIDEQIDDLAETLRQARIFAARAGGRK